ncbi:MAG: tetratricopeptide repeat protein, partial [Gammaproteobacteria bacterium]|nr:tetratricopeptide repeat protein [Gammaproteobacteria bacterium]
EGAGLSAAELENEYRSLAHESYVRGVFLRESGDAVGALQAFQEAVRTSPQDSGLRLVFVEHLQEMGQLRQARAFLVSALERFDGTAEEYLMLARLEMWGGRNEAALTEVDHAIELDPELVEARSLQGQLLIALGDVPGALISFEAADALQPDDPLTQARIAECHSNMGNLDAAIAAWETALVLEPDMHPARAALGNLLLRADRVDEAMELFADGLNRDPGMLGPIVDTLVQSQRYGEAARILESQQAKGLLQPREEYLYARILLYLGREDEAKTLLQGLSGESGLRGIETLLGEMAMRDGRLSDAQVHFDRAIKTDPEDCSAWVNRAVLSAEQLRDDTGRLPRQGDELKQLRALLTQASKVTGDDEYRCHVLLASVYTALREFEPAVAHLEKGYQIDPENTDVQFNLAMAHQELGHFEAALKYGRGVLKHDPNHAPALNFVGYILAERGLDLEDSETLIRRALEQEPDNGYYVDSLGWVLYQSGNYGAATAELERAVELTSESDAVILEHLGDAYVKVERLNDAMRAYGQSQKLEPNNPGLLEKIEQVETQLAE